MFHLLWSAAFIWPRDNKIGCNPVLLQQENAFSIVIAVGRVESQQLDKWQCKPNRHQREKRGLVVRAKKMNLAKLEQLNFHILVFCFMRFLFLEPPLSVQTCMLLAKLFVKLFQSCLFLAMCFYSILQALQFSKAENNSCRQVLWHHTIYHEFNLGEYPFHQ